jgi:DNA polymerase III delta subunit
MIYAKIEDPEQEKRLIDELKTSKDKNWYRRLEIITNSIKRVTVEQLSKTFNVSQATDTSMPLIKVDWTFSSQ